jgi:hypothetical protein
VDSASLVGRPSTLILLALAVAFLQACDHFGKYWNKTYTLAMPFPFGKKRTA